MTEQQRLFLVQARTDLEVFDVLRASRQLPACHALHYMQMATEMLGKAYAWRQGTPARSHRAFVSFLRSLATNRHAQNLFGFGGHNANWEQLIRKSIGLAQRVEDLAPALALDSPNPEYPWPRVFPEVAPAEHVFDVWQDLHDTDGGRKFVRFVAQLFEAADRFL